MTRLAIVLLLAAGACADAHLSDGYGRRTRSALDAQQVSRGQGRMPIDGEDAKIVMQRHRGRGVPQGLGGVGQGGATGGMTSGSSGTGGLQLTPSGQIRVEAVR